MTPDRLRDAIAAAIDIEIEAHERIVTGGGVATFEGYREQVGWLNGLKRARAHADKAYRDMFEDRKIEDKKL